MSQENKDPVEQNSKPENQSVKRCHVLGTVLCVQLKSGAVGVQTGKAKLCGLVFSALTETHK